MTVKYINSDPFPTFAGAFTIEYKVYLIDYYPSSTTAITSAYSQGFVLTIVDPCEPVTSLDINPVPNLEYTIT